MRFPSFECSRTPGNISECTDDIVQPLMKSVGAITIQEYGETVDKTNVLDRIRFYQNTSLSEELRRKLGEKAQKNRKFFTSLGLGEVIQRIHTLGMPGILNVALSLEDSVKSKGLQLYFADPELQRLAENYNLVGQFRPVTGDYLWVVDMNLTPSKDTLYVKPSVRYSVTIGGSGGALSELELIYDYQRQGDRFLGTIFHPYYSDYVRAYVPPGSKLLGEAETEEPVETYHEMGKTVFGNYFKMFPGTIRKIKFRYWQPLKMWVTDGKASYQLVVQKQAGNDLETLEVRVAAPEGAVIDDPGDFDIDGNTLLYRGRLHTNTHFEATFAFH